MVHGAHGLDVSALVRAVLSTEKNYFWRLGSSDSPHGAQAIVDDAYGRLFGTAVGSKAASLIGNETRTLDTISSLSLEIVFEYLRETWPAVNAQVRVLAVPGMPTESPSLLILDPAIPDVSESRRLTDSIMFDPDGLADALDRLRPYMEGAVDDRLLAAFGSADTHAVVQQLLSVSHPEVVATRRPQMVKLSAPMQHLSIMCDTVLSSAGTFCRDEAGRIGVTACFHGTGPVGTPVMVGDAPGTVTLADSVQDIVFIALPEHYVLPGLYGRGGVRNGQAPSEAEPVSFDGAGSAKRVATHVTSHDAGILRHRKTLQLKVQTPADTNRGDSGCSLIDADDRVLGFAFERTGFNEFPELTDWIWADNALYALGVTPV